MSHRPSKKNPTTQPVTLGLQQPNPKTNYIHPLSFTIKKIYRHIHTPINYQQHPKPCFMCACPSCFRANRTRSDVHDSFSYWCLGFDALADPGIRMLEVVTWLLLLLLLLLLLILLQLLLPLLPVLNLLRRTVLLPHGLPKRRPALLIGRLRYLDRVVALLEEVGWYLFSVLTPRAFEMAVFQYAIKRFDTFASRPGTCMVAWRASKMGLMATGPRSLLELTHRSWFYWP